MGLIITGIVIGGNKIGRILGFPTANIAVPLDINPANGVYGARVVFEGVEYAGMANLGVKPSVSGDGKRILEVNIFDFSGDIYGKSIEVELGEFIRPEEKFGSIDELRKQIALDKELIIKKLKS